MPARPLAGPAAWHGREITRSNGWVRFLTPDERAALRKSLDAIRDKPFDSIAGDALPPLPLFDEARRDLLDGRGFVLLRGLDAANLPVDDLARLLWALGLRFGRLLPQNAKGHLIGHVKDLGVRADDPAVRLYQTSERQGFHTDSCDVVALLCVRPARRGGLSSIASTWTAFNEVLRRRPDLAPALFEPIATDHRGEQSPGARPWFSIPILSWHRERLLGVYQRRYIESAQRFPDAPRLTDAQREAMDLLETVLEEIAFRMELQAGDIQLVHNHQILHDRTAFEDDPARPRHLLRLWIAPPAGWELPPVFAERFGSVVPGERGGIRLPGVVPMPSLAP
jgi:hypothetical protein